MAGGPVNLSQGPNANWLQRVTQLRTVDDVRHLLRDQGYTTDDLPRLRQQPMWGALRERVPEIEDLLTAL